MKNLIRAIAATSLFAFAFVAATPARAEDKAAKPSKQQFTGTIETIDATAMTVAVKGKGETKTFTVGEKTKYTAGDKKDATLADFKAGDKVTVNFAADGDKLVASKVATAKAGPKKEKKPKTE